MKTSFMAPSRLLLAVKACLIVVVCVPRPEAVQAFCFGTSSSAFVAGRFTSPRWPSNTGSGRCSDAGPSTASNGRRLNHQRSSTTLFQQPQQQETETTSSPPQQPASSVGGLYRPIFRRVWQSLQDVGCENLVLEEDFGFQETPAKGMPEGSRVTISTHACTGGSNDTNGIQYARAALLETLQPSDDGGPSTQGIQVLNLVVFPNTPQLPVWGADFVSLPGNKHLLLLDAQPMVNSTRIGDWADWYSSNEIATAFPWGGDLPEAVQPYVSQHALWTRIAGGGTNDTDVVVDVPSMVQGPLMQATMDHLQIYLDLLHTSDDTTSSISDLDHHRDAYLRYRLQNDPARPMLTRLFGEEWTENVLETVLFPQETLSSSS